MFQGLGLLGSRDGLGFRVLRYLTTLGSDMYDLDGVSVTASDAGFLVAGFSGGGHAPVSPIASCDLF